MNTRPAATKTSNNGAAWLIAIIVGVVILSNMSKCSGGTATRTAAEVAASDPTIKSLTSAVAAQTPLAVQPLSPAGVTEGIAEMRKSITAEGLSGAMIYSQNCYDALSHEFGWRLLDVCGAADLKGVASVPEDEIVGLDKEIAYFQSEVAAARYLGAATGAGASADEADERLAKVQARILATKPTAEGRTDADNSSSAEPPVDDQTNSDDANGSPDEAV